VAEGNSPHSGGTVPDLHRVPSPLARFGREYTWPMTSRWLPVVAWAAVIFALSSIPSLNSGLGVWDYVLRKCAHMTEYAILAALLVRATGAAPWAFTLAVVYAGSDELHQTLVRGRHGSPMDVVFDAAGAVVGLAAWRSKLGRDGAH
jgi:VanZ like family